MVGDTTLLGPGSCVAICCWTDATAVVATSPKHLLNDNWPSSEELTPSLIHPLTDRIPFVPLGLYMKVFSGPRGTAGERQRAKCNRRMGSAPGVGSAPGSAEFPERQFLTLSLKELAAYSSQ